MPAKQKETISKALSDLGLAEKLLKDVEIIVEDIQKSLLTTGNFVRSNDLAYLMKGQVTMAKFIRRLLSAQISTDYTIEKVKK